MSINKFHNNLIYSNINILLIALCLLCGSKIKADPVPKPRYVVVEIELSGGTDSFKNHASAVMSGMDVRTYEFKQWNNHVIIYAYTPYPEALRNIIAKDYPHNAVKLYDKPFYNFTRKYCNNKSTARAWDNIILSANLVADPKLQKEYLAYHATQFQKWPEVSQGFCNANFQQLQVFKNGRQLMLIISIPKGESLDKLNPLTSKNNPRVDDWNNLMKKYQEGIPGTKKGEVWVFLKPMK